MLDSDLKMLIEQKPHDCECSTFPNNKTALYQAAKTNKNNNNSDNNNKQRGQQLSQARAEKCFRLSSMLCRDRSCANNNNNNNNNNNSNRTSLSHSLTKAMEGNSGATRKYAKQNQKIIISCQENTHPRRNNNNNNHHNNNNKMNARECSIQISKC
mmetsp:Transcript_73600/g.132604  ORF Transcript_73600/g.132604 Transcript_73600/m.132604 type:complete len:156 (-) Transcript_73600:75-542(-)